MRLYCFLANNFRVKTEEDILKQRKVIDHITHTPDSMYINDVRNLRWCTHRENCNFPEAKAAKSAAKKGNTTSKGRHWYTNGVVNKFTKECPLGFTSGKLQKKKSS